MRFRLSSPRLCRILCALTGAAIVACSGSGGGPTGPVALVSSDGGASVDFQGQVRDQRTGAPLAGIQVSGGGASAWTDDAGRFALAATEGLELTFSGTGYYERVSALEGASGPYSIVPLSFNMGAFNDVARDYASGTVRWLSSPDVYLDVRPHNFEPGQSVPAAWIAQVASLAPQFLSRWSGGALAARSVTVGTKPPSAGTPGTLVISFDEDPARYPSAASAGAAIVSWDTGGVIRSATVRLRFSGLSGDAADFSRQAVLGHEIGHAVGLAHMDGTTSSIMAPVVRTPELTAFDLAAGALLYDRRPGTRADDREANSGLRAALAPTAAVSSGAICGVEIEADR